MAASSKKKSKTKGILGLIIFIVVFTLTIAGILVNSFINRPVIPPEGAVGNTSGNLNNRGLFCEADGYIYFSNTYDQRKLYRMQTDGSHLECIADVPVEFINVYGNQVYFYQTPGADNQVFGLGGLYGVCSTDIKGKTGMNNIDKTIVNSLCMYGPNLYYQSYNNATGLKLVVADIKSEKRTDLTDERVLVTTPVNGKFMTYNEGIGYYLSLFNPLTRQFELFDQDARVYNVIVEGDYVYYMNIDDSYRIYRMRLSDYSKEKLTDYKVDLFNVYGNSIFFQRSMESGSGLMRMNIDGSGESLIADGIYTNINCTSEHVYFYEFGEPGTIYRAPINGGQAEKFIPGNN